MIANYEREAKEPGIRVSVVPRLCDEDGEELPELCAKTSALHGITVPDGKKTRMYKVIMTLSTGPHKAVQDKYEDWEHEFKVRYSTLRDFHGFLETGQSTKLLNFPSTFLYPPRLVPYLPSFPSKHPLWNMKALKNIQARADELQVYLQQLFNIPAVLTSRSVRNLIGLSLLPGEEEDNSYRVRIYDFGHSFFDKVKEEMGPETIKAKILNQFQLEFFEDCQLICPGGQKIEEVIKACKDRPQTDKEYQQPLVFDCTTDWKISKYKWWDDTVSVSLGNVPRKQFHMKIVPLHGLWEGRRMYFGLTDENGSLAYSWMVKLRVNRKDEYSIYYHYNYSAFTGKDNQATWEEKIKAAFKSAKLVGKVSHLPLIGLSLNFDNDTFASGSSFHSDKIKTNFKSHETWTYKWISGEFVEGGKKVGSCHFNNGAYVDQIYVEACPGTDFRLLIILALIRIHSDCKNKR